MKLDHNPIRKRLGITSVLGASLLVGLLQGAAVAGEEKLRITGSSTIGPLALEIAKRYEKVHGNMRIDVQTGGSSRGAQDARTGLADIGMVSRELKPSESDLTPHTIAMDGVGVILHSSNPVSELEDQQIVDIYTGKIRDWSEVGGEEGSITVVNKAEGRSTLELFLKYFGLKNSEIRADVIIGDNQQGIKTVAGNPGSIGYVSIGTAEYEAGRGTPIKLLPMSGEAATVANVRNGKFPLSRPLNLVVGGEPSPAATKFLEFGQSDAVDDLIEDQFFVPPQR